MIDLKEIKRKNLVRFFAEHKGIITQNDVAKKLNVDRSYISNLKCGRSAISDSLVSKIAREYDLPEAYFYVGIVKPEEGINDVSERAFLPGAIKAHPFLKTIVREVNSAYYKEYSSQGITSLILNLIRIAKTDEDEKLRSKNVSSLRNGSTDEAH